MSFVLAPKTEGFYYPVSIPVVSESGATSVNRFEMRFKRISRSKLNALQKSQEKITESDIEIDSLERDTDYILDIAEGWRHVRGTDGKDVPFSRESVFELLDQYPSAAGEIVKAFFESTLGGGAKRKN